MLDLIRIAATLAIVAVHLVDGGYPAAIAGVLALYWLSGYLAKPTEPWQWWLSRYARIWPAYAVVFALSAAAFAMGAYSPIYFAGNPPPLTWLSQLALIVEPGVLRVVPVGWMLSAQLFAFGLVAICGDRRDAVLMAIGSSVLLIAAQGWHYQSLPVAAAFTLAGFAMRGQWGKGWRIPGAGLCYPVLLLHYPVAALTGMSKGWSLMLLSIPPTLALSLLLVVVVERPIARYRKSLRSA
jgi:peptidoglycan/LPS O-acetylase OafA/YrhL